LDKAYDHDFIRELLDDLKFTPHIRSRGEEARELREDLGERARRWVVERVHSWINRYPDAAVPAGSQLIPEVAAGLPTVSADGRTYTFRIRPGYRFSPPDNTPVTAQTFKASIERALSPKLGPYHPALVVASDIAGVGAYRADRATQITGIRASGDVLTITLTHRAPDFPTRIASSHFCAVPIGTPVIPNGLTDPIPSAGPYYLTGHIGGVVAVLKRNPSYHGRRPRSLDAIVFTQGIRMSDAVAAIQAGRADYAAEIDPALAPHTPLARRLANLGDTTSRRYSRAPLLGTDYLAFNTRHGLFTNPRLRVAVNAALDRKALAALATDLPTDRYLPPGMPGFQPAHIYPMRPDAQTSRALTQGHRRRAVLAVCSERVCQAIGREVRRELATIGIALAIRTIPGDLAAAPRTPSADIVLRRSFAPYPDPVAFLKTVLSGDLADARIKRISRLSGARRLVAANQLELDLLRHRAPLAAFGTPAIPQLFSARMRCEVSQPPSFLVDLSALCLSERPSAD
jgi:ABC-type oligopeptide transport system substrate-binding subunit